MSMIEQLRNQRKKEAIMENTEKEKQVELSQEELAQVLKEFSNKLEEHRTRIENLEQKAEELKAEQSQSASAKEADIIQTQPDFFERFKSGELTLEDKAKMDKIIVPDVIARYQAAMATEEVEEAQEAVSPEPQETTSPDFDASQPYIEFNDKPFEGAYYSDTRKRYEKLVTPDK